MMVIRKLQHRQVAKCYSQFCYELTISILLTMGLFNLFSKTDIKQPQVTTQMTFEKFCEILASGEKINILKTLNLPLTVFQKATIAQINSNPQDKKNGVTEVYFTPSNLRIFGVFTNCVHKIFKDGSKQYFFYTTISNAPLVQTFANTLKEKLGEGTVLFDTNTLDDRFNSFDNIEQIENISKGFCSTDRDECASVWSMNKNYNIWLQYKVNPLKQFDFHIDEKLVK